MVAPTRCAAVAALAALCTTSAAGTAHHLPNRTEPQGQHHRSESSAVRGLVPPVSAGGGLLEVTQKFTDFMIEKFTGDLRTLVSSIPAPQSLAAQVWTEGALLTRCCWLFR